MGLPHVGFKSLMEPKILLEKIVWSGAANERPSRYAAVDLDISHLQ